MVKLFILFLWFYSFFYVVLNKSFNFKYYLAVFINKIKLNFVSTIYYFIFLFLFLCSVTLLLCPYIFFKFSNLYVIKQYFFLLDNVSLLFVLLTTFIIPLCVFAGRGLVNFNLYIKIFLIMEIFLIGLFLTHNLLLFYFCFEVVTFLMFVVLLRWGYESRRSLASFYLFYYTFFASMLLLLGILLIYYITGSLSFFYLETFSFTYSQQFILWWLFFFAFAVKIPMYPFHIWLPEAHVEAPTGGSILLAGILLKLGFYGFFRYSLILFPIAAQYFLPVIYTLIVLGMLHSMLVSLRQIDAKRIVAYSSIAHMNFALLGLFAWTLDGLCGSILVMLGHGLIASGLFFLIGILYRRYGTRLLFYYSGLTTTMPYFSIIFFFFFLFNVAFPLTINFPGELLVFLALSTKSKIVFFLSMPVILLNLVNTLLLFVRICFGNLSNYLLRTLDVLWWEFLLNIQLIFFSIGFGISPQLILNVLLQ